MKNRKKLFLALPMVITLLISAILIIHITSVANKNNSALKEYRYLQKETKNQNNDYLSLNNDNISSKLMKQGILGTNLNQKKQDMNHIIEKNMKIAYSADTTKDIHRINKNEFSTTLIDNLVENDKQYSDGSYANKAPKLMREGIKNIAIQYGKYDIDSGNIMAVVNIDYKRFGIFNKQFDGGTQAPANDTYILKCNLKSNYVDIMSFNPAILLQDTGDQSNSGGGF
ncbi:hypothetical protein DY052_06310 [Apilactobacillus timberlakei]|uniref:hypothetical protein n=1 Tax=Apilactobacillus timberlakei TaxID=2008380 RepID=UPI00112DE129|nr:hypothetical protein [Apilactobacillus timberlakei]TPR15037.1 hypothetical protein DY052_06310 [Apilactobacillus timberlakei]